MSTLPPQPTQSAVNNKRSTTTWIIFSVMGCLGMVLLVCCGGPGVIFFLGLQSLEKTDDTDEIIAATSNMTDLELPTVLVPKSYSKNRLTDLRRIEYSDPDGLSYFSLVTSPDQGLHFNSTLDQTRERAARMVGGEPEQPIDESPVELTVKEQPAKFVIKSYQQTIHVSGYFQGNQRPVFLDADLDRGYFDEMAVRAMINSLTQEAANKDVARFAGNPKGWHCAKIAGGCRVSFPNADKLTIRKEDELIYYEFDDNLEHDVALRVSAFSVAPNRIVPFGHFIDQILDGAIQDRLDNVTDQHVEEDHLLLCGYKGRGVTITDVQPKFTGIKEFRAFVVERCVFQFTANYKKGSAGKLATAKFFDSFRLPQCADEVVRVVDEQTWKEYGEGLDPVEETDDSSTAGNGRTLPSHDGQ